MKDRRISVRRKETMPARIFFNNRKSGCGCAVQDFSAKGARIGITNRDRVPDEFELYVPGKQKAFPVRVMWRRENELGLIFIDALKPGEASTSVVDLQKRIEKLEREIGSLTQQIGSLATEVARVRL
jgi:PilZ domain